MIDSQAIGKRGTISPKIFIDCSSSVTLETIATTGAVYARHVPQAQSFVFISEKGKSLVTGDLNLSCLAITLSVG
jgi:Cft2 family RNA processing exonuclease